MTPPLEVRMKSSNLMPVIFILFIVLLIVGTNIYVNLGICSLLYCLTNGFTPLTVV